MANGNLLGSKRIHDPRKINLLNLIQRRKLLVERLLGVAEQHFYFCPRHDMFTPLLQPDPRRCSRPEKKAWSYTARDEKALR